MSAPYDPELCARSRATVALELGIVLREGVYVAVPGPESRDPGRVPHAARAWAPTWSGMSTVPEVIVAGHAGMRVLGLSIITDQCLPDALEPADIGADHRDRRPGRAAPHRAGRRAWWSAWH